MEYSFVVTLTMPKCYSTCRKTLLRAICLAAYIGALQTFIQATTGNACTTHPNICKMHVQNVSILKLS